jgi:PAS domain S-box-containing protein
MHFGGRAYRLRITPSADYLKSHRSLQSWAMLVVGTLGAGLLGAIVLLTTGTTSRVKRLIDERTTDLVKVNDELTETQFAMDKVGIGITRVDFDTGRFTYSNFHAADVLGYTRDEMVKLTVSDIDPNYPPDRYLEMKEQIRQMGQVKFETVQQTKEGNQIPVEVAVYYHAPDAGSQASVTVFQTDIRKRKEAERALMEAKEAAEAGSQAKSAFLANMSHEIRTPMNGVIGMTDVLLNTGLTDEQRRLASVIRDSAQAQLGILNDILDFSKIEAGRLDLSLEPFSLADVIEKTCNTFTEYARKHAVSLQREVDTKIPVAMEGDALRVRQILANFTSNAIKFSGGMERPGQVVVSARLVGEENGMTWVDISVHDNGIGMDSATIVRLFHPFVQADSSTTRKYGGTGLGLVISTRLAEAMGGDIRVESTPGVGSIFTAHLPFSVLDESTLAPVADDTVMAELVASPPPSHEEAIRQNRLILVAEDNETNQEVIRQQLAILGYQCDIARDGREAFGKWLGGSYGLILTDIHMPSMDGYQLAENIRLEEATRGSGNIPILALTANVLEGEEKRCQAAGMDGYLAKPAPLPELLGQLTHWLPVVAFPTDDSHSEAPPTDRSADHRLPLFDPHMLARMVGDSPALHRRLMDKYRTSAREQADRLSEALANSDANAVTQIAHGLKSNARTVGAMQLGELCEILERAGKAGDLVTLVAQRDAFTDMFESTARSIETAYPSN